MFPISLSQTALHSVEGLFRIPGNSLRVKQLWLKLRDHLLRRHARVPQPDLDDHDNIQHNTNQHVHAILHGQSPHDLACLLLRCLNNIPTDSPARCPSMFFHDHAVGPSTNGGLLQAEASELCFRATDLQYALQWNGRNGAPDESDDWAHSLCRAQQLLTYRIVVQFLLPEAESCMLLRLLQLFHRVVQAGETTRMTEDGVARCAAVAVFGFPGVNTETTRPELLTSCVGAENPLTYRIDTLANLIRVVDQLDDLPGVVHAAVQHRLRRRFGHSPVHRATSRPVCEIGSMVSPQPVRSPSMDRAVTRTNTVSFTLHAF